MVKCACCGSEVEEDGYMVSFGDKTLHFCGLSCFSHSEPVMDVRHMSLSELTLNKTVYELFAIITGLGGVYYTLFEIGDNALIMDTVSVIAAITAMIIGVEHLRYVEQHQLLKKGILIIGLLILLGVLIFVWHHGFNELY
jgi:hypothetical protein